MTSDTTSDAAPTGAGVAPTLDEVIAARAAEVADHRRGRVPAALRRAHLLAVATKAFVEHGYDRVSMDDLADAMGVSKPVVYDLAGSKEALFRDVMADAADELARRIADAVRAEPDPDRRLFAGALAFFEFVADRRSAWSVLLSGEGGPVSEAMVALRRQQADHVTDLLVEGAVAAGIDVEPLWAEAAAHAVNGAFEALASWWQGHPELGPADLAALVTALVEPGLASMADGPTPAG